MKLVKIASVVGKALKAVQAAATIASFIFTFFMSSELEVITDLINKRLKEVNAKLEWEYKSRNGAKKLSEIRKSMATKSRQID